MIPYETTQTVTTFKQANEIVNQLKEQGVTDINIGMLSWFGGGIHNDPVIGKVSIASSLGGKRALGQFVTDMGADDLTTATHTDELPQRQATYLRFDYKNSGLGSGSCGPELERKYQLCEKHIEFQFQISPQSIGGVMED